MRILHGICSAIVLIISSVALLAQATTPDQGKSLGDIAREQRAKRPAETSDDARQASAPATATATAKPATPVPPLAGPIIPPPEMGTFIDDIKRLRAREDFAELDKMADSVRASKARWPGGEWKLFTVYLTLENVGSGVVTDGDWQKHIAFFHRWVAARPQSITARVGLADAYLGYAWQARGSGFSNTVTEPGWQQFDDRLRQAATTLAEANALPAKCPHWYLLIQRVARSHGADKEQLRAILDKAIAFEPEYYSFYQEYAFELLPKWGGEPGDAQAFAEETYRRAGKQKGAFLYFEIASSLCGRCGDFSVEDFSWAKLQEGFAAMEQLYGVSPLKINQFAYIAVAYADRDAAAKTFPRIGAFWDPSVWDNRAQFDMYRRWAGLTEIADVSVGVPGEPAPLPDQHVRMLLNQGSKAVMEKRYDDARKLFRDAIAQATIPEAADDLVQAYLTLARLEQQQNGATRADEVLQEGYTRVAKASGAESDNAARVLQAQAFLQLDLHNQSGAEEYERRALQVREKVFGTSSVDLINDLMTLGNFCVGNKKYDEGLALLQRAIKIEEVQDHAEPMLGALEQSAGYAYQNLGKYPEAEAAYLRSLRLRERVGGHDALDLSGPLTMLAKLYRQLGRTDEAKQMQDRLDSLQRRARQ